jgi:hypothetical protein
MPATYTSTITEGPADGVVTVYYGDDGQPSTWGVSTVYEVYIYTTTQAVDVVGSGVACGVSWGKRTAAPAVAPYPATVMATATPVA